MSNKPLYHSSASLSMLQLRALLLRATRQFFDAHEYFEVETPLLSHDIVVDAWLEPFQTSFSHLSSSSSTNKADRLFLQTSPEFGMKRLLSSGAKAIYQITRSFRNGEVGTLHNPEFTILEWYRVGDNHFDQMSFVETLVRKLFDVAANWMQQHAKSFAKMPPAVLSSVPFEQTTYDAAFLKSVGTQVLHLETDKLKQLAIVQKLNPPESLADDDRDGWLNYLLAECVEPKLGQTQPMFLYDYPASQAALAQVRDDDPPVAERFELYMQGIEICNGYHELTDADELRRRIAEQSQLRAEANLPPLPSGNLLLSAMDAGFPACCGVALGVDRLIMLATGATDIQDVIAFPFDRA